jgi:hypothetical protein
MHLPLGVDHDTTNPTHYNSSFAQVNGKHAERLVLANTIHLFSPAHNRETRRGLQSPGVRSTPKCGQLYAVVNCTIHLNEHKTQAGHLDNRHE